MTTKEETFIRFSYNSRLGHLFMIISFVVLAVTGLPQKFHSAEWAQTAIAMMGGIEQVREVHRWAAIVLIAVGIHHMGYAIYVLIKRGPRSWLPILPSGKDFKDVYHMVLYLFGMRKDRPMFDTFSYKEKFDYWAVFWGMVIMGVSGLILWFPAIATRWMPGTAVPIAKIAHSDEALLAVMAIVFWHMYNVHFNTSVFPFNATMFTGKIGKEQIIEEHPLEYARLTGVDPDTLRHNEPPTWGAVVMSGISGIFITLLFAYLLWIGFSSPSPTPEMLKQAFAAIPPGSVALAASEVEENDDYKIEIITANPHQDIALYEGPVTCGQAGCHPDQVDTATASAHNQRVAVAGPQPLLAKLVKDNASTGEIIPNCLLCHAKDYKVNDPLASTHTVQPAGGQTCLRCHSSHPESDVHNDVGLACVSCHTSNGHQMSTQAACTNCHAEMPHLDPFINVKHNRLDCRTCHTNSNVQMMVNTGQSAQDPTTGFFAPAITSNTTGSNFAWQDNNGFPASIEAKNAIIVPLMPVTLQTPAMFDPLQYALTGEVEGATKDITVNIVPGHGITKENARTCDTCHGPEGDFDFANLGYSEEQADNLSAKPAPPETE